MCELTVHHAKFFQYEPFPINCMAYNEYNKSLAVSRSSGVIEIWRTDCDWYQEKVIYASEGHSIEALAWREDVLYTAGLDGNLVEIDMVRLAPKKSIPSNGGAIWCLKINKAMSTLAAGTEEGCVVLYEYADGCFHYDRQLNKQEGRILSLCWNDSGSLIVTGGLDDIRLWNVKSGHAVQRITMARQHTNKPTIVWSVALLGDNTVVSGDSRGRTSFWNGDQGTLIKEFQSHKADVHAVCVTGNDTVISAGIDPTLVQFRLTSTREGVIEDDERSLGGELCRWVRSATGVHHTHDVRALASCGSYIASGGVDCGLHLSKFGEGPKFRKLGLVPEHKLVTVAREANVILFQYLTHLELWRLGASQATAEKNGDLLPLSSNALQLVKLVSRGGEHIVCSAVDDQATCIAYSDRHHLRIFKVTVNNISSIQPLVHIERLRSIDMVTPPPSHGLCFHTQVSDGARGDQPASRLHLFSGSVEGTLDWIEIQSDHVTPVHRFSADRETPATYRILAVSSNGRSVAGINGTGHVDVFSTQKKQLEQTLPKRSAIPTALAFHPDRPFMALTYTDQHVVEYDLKRRAHSAWYRKNCERFHYEWLNRHCTLTHVQYCPSGPSRILVHDCQLLCIIDKTEPFPKKYDRFYRGTGNREGGQHSEKPHAFHSCMKYKYLLHFEELSEGWAVAVERTQCALQENLPPALRRKRFGV